MQEQKKSLLFLVLPVFFAIILSFLLQSTILANQEKYISWLSSFGPVFILVYILVQIIAIVIAPLGGFFIQLGVLALLPPTQAVILIYLVTTPAFFINFFLAKHFGRPIILRLIGQKAIETVDYYANDVGVPMVLVMKIFQSGVFDYVSYAAGLTSISWKEFALINILGGVPAVTVQYIIFSQIKSFTVAVGLLIAISYTFFGITLFVIHKYKQKKTLTQT